MQRMAIVVIFLMSAILSGCGSTSLYTVKEAPFVVSEGEKLDLAVRPHESLGIKATPAILAGRVTVFKEFTISDKIFYAEEYPGRIRWNAWVVCPDGREYFAQIVRVGISYKGQYRYSAIVDAMYFELEGARIIGLSSMLKFALNFEGDDMKFKGDDMKIEAKEFAKRQGYRFWVAAKFGTPVKKLKRDESDFASRILSLNRYGLKDEGGEIFCEYAEEDFRKIARINPGYGIMEKFILHSKGQINIPVFPEPNLVAVGAVMSIGSAMIDFMLNINDSSQGWDYMSSPQNDQTRAFVMMWCTDLRKNYEEEMARKVAKLESELADYKLAEMQAKGERAKLQKQPAAPEKKVAAKKKKGVRR